MNQPPKRLVLPTILTDAKALRMFANTAEGREQLRTVSNRLQEDIALDEANLATAREGVRLILEALSEVRA